MQVRDLMTHNVITVTPDTPIQKLAWIMRANQISGVPVVNNEGKLVGFVSELDLISRHAPAKEPTYFPLLWGLIPFGLDDYADYKEQVRHILAVNAAELMSTKVTTVGPDDSIDHVATQMMKRGHRSLPVVENGKIIGIVTRTDLVQLIEELEMAEDDGVKG